ncbi:uncharacterized protein A4U43_C07F39110 [Asparagus officinalis]|uniref:BHLH domain-containing protein n=1 Tax=Asparagus officinalis TaxID=4686 RepID=A0A5P1EIC6_ASPOF|nr:uncharacterized protein A4U43_C07F39110 [Asparagus officinalis]
MPRYPRDCGADFDAMDFVDSTAAMATVVEEEEAGGGGGGGEGFGDPAIVADTGEARYRSKNLEAERRRRSKLNNRLFTLRSLMSKESTLVDAIDYIQKLQKRICDLKLELSKLTDEDQEKKGSASSTESIAPPEIKLCPVQLLYHL